MTLNRLASFTKDRLDFDIDTDGGHTVLLVATGATPIGR
jgi:hypothetical protein